jgi:hypothetical protein
MVNIVGANGVGQGPLKDLTVFPKAAAQNPEACCALPLRVLADWRGILPGGLSLVGGMMLWGFCGRRVRGRSDDGRVGKYLS